MSVSLTISLSLHKWRSTLNWHLTRTLNNIFFESILSNWNVFFSSLSWWWNRIKTRRVNCNGRIHKTDSIFKADRDFLSCCVNIFSIRISQIILKPTPKMITILFWLEIIERNGRRKSIEICLQELKFIIYREVNTIHLFHKCKISIGFLR